MNSPAFTAPCSTALSSRTAFSGLSVSRCVARAPQLSVASRPARFTPRMQTTPPEGASEASDSAPAVDETPLDMGMTASTTATLEPEVNAEDVEYPPCDPPQPVINARAISEAQQKFKIHETDSGSPEFQIATLSTRITYLTEHLKSNPKDYSSTRGLVKMVSTRRRLLKFLKSEDPQRFTDIIAGLNIRISQQLREI